MLTLDNDLIPEVKEEIFGPIIQQGVKEGWDNDFMAHLKERQPSLYRLLTGMIAETETDDEAQAIISGAGGIYIAINSQLGANELNEMFAE